MAVEKSQVSHENFKAVAATQKHVKYVAKDDTVTHNVLTKTRSSSTGAKAKTRNNSGSGIVITNEPSLQVSGSGSKGTPFSKKTTGSATGTCVKVRKQGEYRYSSSPLGKRIDIYETSETEEDGMAVENKSIATPKSEKDPSVRAAARDCSKL